MQLRNGTMVGSGIMPAQHRPAFEEGAKILFRKWTALSLAVENEWGGAFSKDKAQYFLEDTIEWFYKRKGATGITRIGAHTAYQGRPAWRSYEVAVPS